MNDELNQFKSELQKLRGAKYSLNNIIGTSASHHGNEGTCKEGGANEIDSADYRGNGNRERIVCSCDPSGEQPQASPFIALNCAAIPKDLIESELFGYEEGAFSGARKGGKPGKFEMAHQGTLYLDEIDQLPLSLQSKMLRAIQEKEIERIGGTKTIYTDIRLICTSNRSLRELVEKGEFREDLYYRIHVATLHVPPLRERLGDVPKPRQSFHRKDQQRAGPQRPGCTHRRLKIF